MATATHLQLGVYIIRSKHHNAVLTATEHYVAHGAPVVGAHQLLPHTFQEVSRSLGTLLKVILMIRQVGLGRA